MCRTVLTNVMLYRWYGVEKMQIPVQGNVLITARNKTGKSTILDAIKYALTTSSKFNRAANQHDQRDVNSYIRKYTNGESSIDGFLTSNVALEFQKSNGKKFVLGVIIDSPRDGDVNPSWYIIDKPMGDLIFESDSVVLDKKNFKKDNGIDNSNFLDTKKDARLRIKNKLGIKDMDMYIEKIDQLSAYNPPKNTMDFYKAILKENNIVIDSLIESVKKIKEIQSELVDMEKSKQLLERIETYGNKYRDVKRKHEVRQCVAKRFSIAKSDSVISDARQKIEINNGKINACNSEIQRLSIIKECAEKELHALGPDDERIEHYKSELKEINQKNERLESEIAELKTEIEKIRSLFVFLESHEINIGLTKPSEIFFELGVKSNISVSDVTQEIIGVKNNFEAIRDEITEECNSLKNSISEKSSEILSLSKEENALSSGVASYPNSVVSLKQAIMDEFKNRGISSAVNILCDLITSVKDDSWSKAIESYLGNSRFSIIVEPKYALVAQEVQRKSNCYGCQIIATNRLTKDFETNPKSLFSLLEISNVYAKKYLAFRLGNVVMCNDIGEFNDSSIGITKDCFVYKAYATQKYRPTEDFYCGKEAKKKQLEKVRKNISVLKQSLETLQEKRATYIKINNEIKDVNFNKIFDYKNSYPLFVDACLRIETIRRNIEDVSKELDLIAKHEKESELNNKVSSCKNNIDYQIGEKLKFEHEIKICVETIEETKKELPLYQSSLDSLISSFGFTSVEIENEYDSYVKTNSSQCNADYYRDKTQFAAKTLREAMVEFQRRTNASFACEEDELPKYLALYNELKNVKYEKLKTRLTDERESLAQYVGHDLINGLNERFIGMRKIIRQINNNLKESFEAIDNDEYYAIEVKPSVDSELTDIYNIVTNRETDFELFENPEDIRKINELIKDLLDSNTEMEDFQQKICDYRNYFKCDIVVHNKLTGNKINLSKTSKSASGMESQIPYYIIASVCISLASTDEAPAVIVIDEAFDKLDAAHIKKIMNFFNYQGVQVVMATPPERLESLKQYINELVPLAKTSNNVVVYTEIQYFRETSHV